MLGFLDTEQLAKFGGPGGLAFANRFTIRLEQAEHLVRVMRVMMKNARLRLRNYPAHQWDKVLQPGLITAHRLHPTVAHSSAHVGRNLGTDPLRIAHRAAHD